METRYLKIGLIFILLAIIVFVLVKFLLPKKTSQPPPPPSVKEVLSPEETVIKYLSLEFEKDRQEAEEYLFSDHSKIEVLREGYSNIGSFFLNDTKGGNTQGSLPEYNIKNEVIEGDRAKVNLEVATNKLEGSIFFIFSLPKNITFEADLVKERENWKIIKIDSPTLVLVKNLGQKGEVIENVFVTLNKIGEYQPVGIKPPVGLKFISAEVEYENKSNTNMNFLPLSEWRLTNDSNKEIYYPTFTLIPSREERIAVPAEIKLNPDETKRGSFFFQVPKDLNIKELVFQNLEKRIIFEIY